MAQGNIETFASNVAAPRADQAGSEAYEQLGRHAGAAYSAAASAVRGGIGALGDAYEKHQSIVEAADVSKGFADLEIQTAKDLDTAKSLMDPHDKNTVSDFMGAHQETLDNLGADLQTDEGRRLYQELSNNYRVNTTNKVIGWASSAAAADTLAKLHGTVTSYANLAQEDPTSAGNYAANIDALAPNIPTEYRAKAILEAKQTIYDSAGEGLLNKLADNPNATMGDVASVKKLLTDPDNGYVGNMSPGQYNSVNQRIDKVAETIGATSSVIAAQNLGAGNEKLKMNGGIDQGGQLQSIINNYHGATPAATLEFKAKAQRELDDAKAYGQVAKVVNSTPQTEVAAAIQGLRDALKTAPADKASLGEARLKAATEAAKARDEAFQKDPALWLNQNNEVVKSRYAAFATNQTAANFQAYAATSIAEQRRLYPNEVPNIMPAEMEDTIRGQLKIDLTTKEGPVAASNILSSYARVAGQYWPQMAIKLRQDKVLPAGMGVAAELYGNPQTQALGEEVIRATAVPPQEREARFGITKEKAEIAAAKELKPLIKTMGNMPNGDQIISDYRDALGALYQYHGSVNAGDASAVAQKLITGRYDIEGETLRIPKALGLDGRRIGDGAAAVKSDIGSHDIIMPPHFQEMSVSRESYLRQLRDTGHWYANENGTGAVLYDEDMHTVKEVVNGRAVDVELSWDALGKVADKKPLRRAMKATADALSGVIGDGVQ